MSRLAAFAWNPTAPSYLMSLQMHQSGDNARVEMSKYTAQDGTGASSVETSTLLQILSSSPSKNYRRVVENCLKEWDAEKEDNTQDGLSLELLKLLFAVLHVTETLVLNKKATMVDVVSYLRLHHMPSLDIPDLSAHPEDSPSYWVLLQALVLRGCTSDVWALLTFHSGCRRAFASQEGEEETLDDYHAAQRAQDRAGFLALRAILESAPLPGGRDELNDDDAAMSNEGEDTTQLMDHVGRLDYKLWSSTSPRAAMTSFRAWQEAIGTSKDLPLLLRREPRLEPLLQVLRGDFSTTVSSSWAQALCADLLYVRPHLTMQDLPARMNHYMTALGHGAYDKILLSILEGNHGSIVQVLYSQLGGGSGAALPSTMTALVCNLLVDAKLLPESAKELQTELMVAASAAILTSHGDIGMRLAALLLTPHCKPDAPYLVATLAEALERYAPMTDAAAHEVLDIVKPLVVDMKSMRILEGCIGMIVGRYHYSPKPIEWLMLGKKLEDDLIGDEGTCLRLICQECIVMSQGLLALICGRQEGVTSTLAAKNMVLALGNKLDDIDAVRLLHNITAMALAFLENTDDKAIAENITKCLVLEKGHVLAPFSMQIDLLVMAKNLLLQEEDRFGSANAADFQAAFTVHGCKALMERYMHITTMDNTKEDMIMHQAIAQGLMRSMISENAKRKRPILKHDVTRLRPSCIDSYSRDQQDQLVAQMLDL